MHKIIFTKRSEKKLKKLASRNKVVNNLLKKKFTISLPQINLKEALKSEKVKLVSGISPAILDLLKEKNLILPCTNTANFQKGYLLECIS